MIQPGTNQSTGGSIVGAVDTIIGVDYCDRVTPAAHLDTLLRLKTAVFATATFPRSSGLQAKLDDDLDRASRSRGTGWRVDATILSNSGRLPRTR